MDVLNFMLVSRKIFRFWPLLLGSVLLVGLVTAQADLRADESRPALVAQVSPTAVPVMIPTSGPLATAGATPTIAPPTFTPTEVGRPMLEVREDIEAANVRIDADPESELLGSIRPGDQYQVTGRFFRWLQFRFDASPNGLGYVYDELVVLSGDETRIVDLSQSGQPTQDLGVINETETAAVIQQTPGFELTITADARVIEAPGTQDGNLSPESTLEVLPTFTYPPNVVAMAPTEPPIVEVTATPNATNINVDVSNGVAPIVPIVVLVSLGLIGFLIGIARR